MLKNTSSILYRLTLVMLVFLSFKVMANPQLLGDIGITDRNGSHPSDFFEFNGVVYFTAENERGDRVLWASDGISSWHPDEAWQLSIPTHFSSSPFIRLGNAMYFIADDGVTGHELWKFDGTNVSLVADINQGSGHSLPGSFKVADSTLFFLADDGVSGYEIWKYDGSSINMVADINPGIGSTYLYELAAIDNTLYFSADAGSSGHELWKYDGTNISLVDINSGIDGSSPTSLTAVGSTLYFRATDGVSGRELWQYDGTSASLVADIYPGKYSSSPYNLTVVGNTLFFSADDGITGTELWQYDGTSASQVADINPGSASSSIRNLTVADNRLYFGASNNLWQYDGTSASLAVDLPDSRYREPGNITAVGNSIYFTAYDKTSSDLNLWQYDGTSASQIAIDIYYDPFPYYDSKSNFFIALGDTLYFSTFTANSGKELWQYDGTSARLAADINQGRGGSSPKRFIVTDDALYFAAFDDETGEELWKYDGTQAFQFANVRKDYNDSNPFNFTHFDGITYFVANRKELWATDGVTIWLIEHFSGYIDYLTVANNSLYFFADDGVSGGELWQYDGSSTSQVADINPGRDSSYPYNLTSVGNRLFFGADDGISGTELWQYDGSSASQVADINPGRDSSRPYNLTSVGNRLFFGADDGISGRELWQYDGSSVSLVADINPGSDSSYLRNLTVVGNTLFFSARDGVSGRELWQYDGSSASLVADINPGSGYSSPDNLTVVGNRLFFSADDGNSGEELWQYDGSSVSLVADINPGSDSSYLRNITVVGNRLYFSAYNGISGSELWQYNGSSASLVADINPGSGSSSPSNISPSNITVVNNTLFFIADDGSSGEELWQYDGTTASQVADIYPGSASSSLRKITVVGNRLYFSADDGVTGNEPWVLSLEPTDPPTPALSIDSQVNGLQTTKPGATLSAGNNITWTYTTNNIGNTPLYDVSVRVRQKAPVFGNWQTLCSLGTVNVNDSASCEWQDLATDGAYIALVVVTGTTSTGEIIESSSKAFYQGEQTIDDPALVTKRNIALGVLETKGYDQATYDAYLLEINAATTVSELHAIIVRMREDTSGTDPRLDAKRTIALDLLDAKDFDQATHNALLTEINAAASVNELHAIIVRMREDNLAPQLSLSLSVTANDNAVTKPGPVITAGEAINWTYTVTNTGNADLHNILITQRQKLPTLGEWETPCSFTIIAAGETQSCRTSTTAIDANYKALIVARSTLASGDNIEDKVDAFYQH